jgi:N-[(2S)-2-amino-2-carboxyethyl]-L-glutamate dehydrogenase
MNREKNMLMDFETNMQNNNRLAILTADHILSLLEKRERDVLDVIKTAYCAHARRSTNCPHSLFLRLPRGGSRIIALPAYIGEDVDAAGVKWISSFPSNLEAGLPRASALIVLNSMETGRAYAVMEGSIISAKRTAASAALAAERLVADSGSVKSIGIIGCGEINREVLGFLRETLPSITLVRVFDTNSDRARSFRAFCEDRFSMEVLLAQSTTEVLSRGQIISIATTTVDPHILSLSACPPSTVILHISLRDLAPEALYAADNIVDDLDHVCRENTSLDLAAKAVGHKRFIRTAIGDILNGAAPPTVGDGRTVVFSPFGLGILDISLASHVYKAACGSGRMSVLPEFHPAASL